MQEKFGLSAALATPFDENGLVDGTLLAKHASACLSEGCNSVTLLGTTGEGASVGLAGPQGAPDRPCCLGHRSGDPSLAVRCAGFRRRRRGPVPDRPGRGVPRAAALPAAYFNFISDDGVFAWFSSVFAQLGSSARDIFLYHIPAVTGVPISAEVVTRLRAAFPGAIAGIKDSSGDRATAMRFLADHGDLAVLIGDERLLAEAVRHGAQGAISVLPTSCPAGCER